MNEAIELHDSELAGITSAGDTAVVALRPAYIHRSSGLPGSDAGSGWLQDATLTFSTASVLGNVVSQTVIADGALHIGSEVYDGIIPASGTFEGPVELRLLLAGSGSVQVRGERLTIALQGEAVYLEDFRL